MSYSRDSIERRLLDDDPEALGQVIRWISGVLTAPRFWSLRSEWTDLKQEVLMRVVESLRQERFDPCRDFRFYVQGVARFTVLQALSRRNRSDPLPMLREPPSQNPVDPETQAVRRQLIRRIFEDGTEECRDLIRLYFLEDQSYSEIAASHSLPVGTVKSRLFRCLQGAHEALRRVRSG